MTPHAGQDTDRPADFADEVFIFDLECDAVAGKAILFGTLLELLSQKHVQINLLESV
jgi:hypothetical protein